MRRHPRARGEQLLFISAKLPFPISEMEFQRRLLDVVKSLSADEVRALGFLCTDLLGPNPTDSANELFRRLQERDHLSEERPHLLTELLVTVGRGRLVSNLGLSNEPTAAGDLVSPYRKLLYELSEEITDEALREMKFLLHNTLKRRALDDNVPTLDVFLEMERMDRLSDTNLDELETIIQSICPALKEKIDQFKAKREPGSRPIAQESEESAFTSFSPNQGSLSSYVETNPSWHRQDDDENQNMVQQFSSLSAGGETFARSTVGTDAYISLTEEEEEEIPVNTQSKGRNTQGLGSYAMTGERGVCLIINNYNFAKAGNLSNREGTNIDEQCLVDVFSWLGYVTDVHCDCTSVQMLTLLQELGRRDHSQMDSVVCCILSHGKEGSVLGVDGVPVKLADLREPLNGSKCVSLASKPKLFFIQACQGNANQRTVWLESDGHPDTFLCCDAVAVKSIPADADFLFAMSTVPSFVSFRDKRNGSWFMQSLCQNLLQMVPRGSDLVSILTQVNADVSQKTDNYGVRKQMPQPQFTLTKRVVFPPPGAAPPSLPSL